MPGARRARHVVPGTVQSPEHVQQQRWASIGHSSQLRLELCTKGVVEGVHGPETGTGPAPPGVFFTGKQYSYRYVLGVQDGREGLQP